MDVAAWLDDVKQAIAGCVDSREARIARAATRLAEPPEASRRKARAPLALRIVPFVVLIGAVASTARLRLNRAADRADDPATQLRETARDARHARAADARALSGASDVVAEVELDSRSAAPLERGRRLASGRGMAFTANTTALKEFLLAGYDASTPPPFDAAGRAPQVQVQCSLQKLLEISTFAQEIMLYGWWRHFWTDERLAWDAAAWGGVDFLTFPIHPALGGTIWGPDTLLYDSMKTEDIIPFGMASVYPSGAVFFSTPRVHTIPCTMLIADFPFDTQRCGFLLGSWSYHGLITDVVPRLLGANGTFISAMAVEPGVFKPHTEFALTTIATNHYEFFYSCCVEPYPIISYELALTRAARPYFNGIILPLILSTCAGFVAFITNPHAGERIGLGITVLLVIGVIYSIADAILPKARS